MVDEKSGKMDIKSRDVIQIVQQFLYENNLMETLKTLEKESNIAFTSKSINHALLNCCILTDSSI